jgi:hypothetical protein
MTTLFSFAEMLVGLSFNLFSSSIILLLSLHTFKQQNKQTKRQKQRKTDISEYALLSNFSQSEISFVVRVGVTVGAIGHIFYYCSGCKRPRVGSYPRRKLDTTSLTL